jgi:hypothetical protein
MTLCFSYYVTLCSSSFRCDRLTGMGLFTRMRRAALSVPSELNQYYGIDICNRQISAVLFIRRTDKSAMPCVTEYAQDLHSPFTT